MSIVNKIGSWKRVEGTTDDVSAIESAKQELMDHTIEQLGYQPQNVEWNIQQMYNHPDGTYFDDKPFDGAVPYVAVAWKGETRG